MAGFVGLAFPGTRVAVGRKMRLAGAVLAASLLLTGAAFAAFHTTNGIYHGIGSTNGGGLGSGQPYAGASTSGSDYLNAGMYHQNDNGTWNTQCYVNYSQLFAQCSGAWGTAPCRKYAWTSGYYTMAWHGMRSAAC